MLNTVVNALFNKSQDILLTETQVDNKNDNFKCGSTQLHQSVKFREQGDITTMYERKKWGRLKTP